MIIHANQVSQFQRGEDEKFVQEMAAEIREFDPE